HVGSIAPGDTSGFDVTVALDAAAVPGVTNFATVSAAGDVEPANDRDDDSAVVGGVVDVKLDKRHTGSFVDRQNGTWTMVVTNVGSATTTGATTVTDTLPAGATFGSASGTGWTFVQNGQEITGTYAGSIASGDSAAFDLT